MSRLTSKLQSLTQSKVNELFFNTDIDCAIDVLVSIFQISNDIIRIFARSLSGQISTDPRYIRALTEFIERGGKVRIILNQYESNKAKTSSMMKRLALYKLQGKNIEIRKTNTQLTYSTNLANAIYFTIGDDRSYRVETNPQEHTADCNLNDKIFANKLINIFDQVFKESNGQCINLLDLFNLK